MSLKEQLEAHARKPSSSSSLELRKANEFLVEHLHTTEMLDSILTVGNRMPDFDLADCDGTLVSSRDLLHRGALVVSFFRGDWCPYCRLELGALELAVHDIEREGALLVAITPDTCTALAETKRNNHLSMNVLSDADNGVALQFGVAYRVPQILHKEYLKHGIDLGARHGNDGRFLPIPATFVVDRAGIIRHAEFDADHRRRMEPADIVEVLRRLST